jgi:uncharacterized protein YuzE
MDKLRVNYDREGNTLSVWFDDPKKECVCEEADDDMVLVKDRRGRVIGFERLNYLSAKERKAGVSIPVEVQMGSEKGDGMLFSGEKRTPSAFLPARNG